MKLSTFLALLPVALVAVLIAVANRETVTFRLDPFSSTDGALAFAMPLFLLVFLTFLSGVLVGGAAVAFQRGRMARKKRLTAKQIGTALALNADKRTPKQTET